MNRHTGVVESYRGVRILPHLKPRDRKRLKKPFHSLSSCRVKEFLLYLKKLYRNSNLANLTELPTISMMKVELAECDVRDTSSVSLECWRVKELEFGLLVGKMVVKFCRRPGKKAVPGIPYGQAFACTPAEFVHIVRSAVR